MIANPEKLIRSSVLEDRTFIPSRPPIELEYMLKSKCGLVNTGMACPTLSGVMTLSRDIEPLDTVLFRIGEDLTQYGTVHDRRCERVVVTIMPTIKLKWADRYVASDNVLSALYVALHGPTNAQNTWRASIRAALRAAMLPVVETLPTKPTPYCDFVVTICIDSYRNNGGARQVVLQSTCPGIVKNTDKPTDSMGSYINFPEDLQWCQDPRFVEPVDPVTKSALEMAQTVIDRL